jgi:cysteine desulfurase/selenocysteine lyase
MSTSDRPDETVVPSFAAGPEATPSLTEHELTGALTKEIERLANELFRGGIPPLGAGALPGSVVPPEVGPSAAHVGAGGLSPAATLPPIPGPLHRPPLAAAPPPKESDLRAIPTLLSEHLGTPSPIALASSAPAESTEPYFLGLSGLPTSAPSSTVPIPSSSAFPPLPGGAGIGDVARAPVTSPGTSPGTSAPALPVLDGRAYDFRPEVIPDLDQSRGIFDAYSIKRDFPILSERVHGRPIVWLDNAATTQKPQSVIDRLSYFYEHENSNVHRAAHALAARATDAYEAARDKVRRFINAPSPKEIVFIRGTTEAINLVAQSWGRRNVGPGDEIVITWLEHHANIVPWQLLCSEKKARLRVAPVDDDGQVILDEYEKLLGPKTRIVSFTQVSNALGTVTPAREMVEMAHRHGALALVDGAQSTPHMRVDVQELDCDFFCFSGHKIFGPTGIGALYGKNEILDAMPPWQGGGNMITDVTFQKTTYQSAPLRFEAGTGNIADAVGLGAALDYVTALGIENVHTYETELRIYAEEGLRTVPGLRMIGTAKEKAGVLSFVLDGVRTEDIGAALDEEGIAVRSGHHCAQPILRRFGVESTVRASLAPYNTRDDIDALVAALKRLQAGRPSRGL